MQFLSALRSVLACALACGLLVLASPAQTIAARVGTATAPMTAHMIVGDSGIGRVSVRAHQPGSGEKLIYAQVRNGIYTVDGMVAKLRLNYDVQGVRYMYLFVPGVGTAVISAHPDRNALTIPVALQADTLSFTADGHHFSLTGVNLASDNGQPPAHLYVRLDRLAWRLSRTPMVGFGDRGALPYEWPGALPSEQADESQSVPPMPVNLLPSLSTVAPAVQPPAAVGPAALRPSSLR